jgi:hypothetical protein
MQGKDHFWISVTQTVAVGEAKNKADSFFSLFFREEGTGKISVFTFLSYAILPE